MKTHWKKLQNPDYLGSWDFQPKERKILTMDKVTKSIVHGPDGRSEECSILHFKDKVKPMVLNNVNQKTISKVVGSPYIEDWNGHRIELYVTSVKAFGETVDGVRVAPAVTTRERLDPSHAKWNDAVNAIKSGKTTIEAIRKSYELSDDDAKLLTDAV